MTGDFNPSMVGKIAPILPMSWAIISTVGQKKKKKKKGLNCECQKQANPPSFSTIPISFHSVDSARK